MENLIRLEAYYNHLKYPNNTELDNWLLAEKKVKSQNEKSYKLNNMYKVWFNHICYSQLGFNKTILKDSPTTKKKLLFIIRKNNRYIKEHNMLKICMCKNMNSVINSQIRKITYPSKYSKDYILI